MGNIIKMDLKELELEGVYWIKSYPWQGPEAGSCEHGNKSSGFIKYGQILTS